MDNLYKFAVINQLRFPSKKGGLTVEQLYMLPLQTTLTHQDDLESIAQAVYKQLQDAGTISFVDNGTVDPKKKALQIQLDIIKDVIATKQEANKAALASRERKAEIQKIRDLVAAKRDEKLTQASEDELLKKLAELEAKE